MHFSCLASSTEPRRTQLSGPGGPGQYLPGPMPLGAGDVLLQASEDRVDPDEGGAMMDILLPVRARRLMRALSPLEGWGATASALRRLLRVERGPLIDYEEHLQQETLVVVTGEGLGGEGRRGKASAHPPFTATSAETYVTPEGFKQWLGSKLRSMVDSLERAGLALLHDLPSGMLSGADAANAEAALLSARGFIEAMAQLSPGALFETCNLGLEAAGGRSGPIMMETSRSGPKCAQTGVCHFCAAWTALLDSLSAPVVPSVPSNLTRSGDLTISFGNTATISLPHSTPPPMPACCSLIRPNKLNLFAAAQVRVPHLDDVP